ncbi:SPIN90/Ldb17 leucine-rich domain-containing protein [Entamoeba marina]
MDDVDWSLRNSASILASSVVRRLFSTKETFKQQLIQDALLCAMKRKLTAPCVEALGVAFTRCIPNSIIDIIVKDLSSVGLFILAEYVKTGSTLSQSQIQQVVSFIPKTSFEADKLFNLLFILNKPLPNLSSLHFQTQDAYTLRCIRLVATYHSKDNINVLLMLKSNDVIVRETALMRCQEHPNGVDAKQFFDITKPLLNEDAPHVLNVLNAMNSIIKENINQNKNVCSFIGDTNSFVDQLQKLVDNEPLVKCSAIAILLYFKPLSMEYISCIGNDQITLETYFMKYLSERKVEVMLNAVATMLEDLEKNITVTLALNSVFKMDFDPQHMLNHLILEIVQLGNKEQIQTLINIVLDIQIFDYLYEITHTTQIFEPELPTFLVDRVELLLLIKKHIADNSYIESIYTNIKTSATRCQTNNSTEYLKQLCESFEKMN